MNRLKDKYFSSKINRRLSLQPVIIVLTATSIGFGQISSGGIPASFQIATKSAIATVTLPTISLAEIASLEAVPARKDEPFQFGYPFDVAYTLENSGSWENLPDGSRLWRLQIKSDGAYSLNLIFDNFHLSENARLFVYTPDHKSILGAFTAQNNKPHGKFATAPTPGSSCILELNEPSDEIGRSHFTLTRIVHGYRDIFFKLAKDFGGAGACNININAPQGADWQIEKRAVALVITAGGHRLCSGALVNNLREDYTQYFLTANHCLGEEESWIVMFNYESPYGSNSDGPTNYTIQGATLRASSSASDFALLELTEPIPVEYNVYFAGWNALATAATQTACIHHPMGDVKKISLDYQAPHSATWTNTPSYSHWQIVWDQGTTEPGSSGGPLFDQNHRIVGQLHGGYASCDNPSGADYFGKLALSWDYLSEPTKQLKYWLDPENTGQKVLDGRDYLTVAIQHQPLPDFEDSTGPYSVFARVITIKPPLRYVKLVWGYDGVFSDTLDMNATANPDEYLALIPGGVANRYINYFFIAADGGPDIVTEPRNAPQNSFSFYVGSDSIPPLIQHTPLTDIPVSFMPAEMRVKVTDNLGIDTVFCEFFVNDSNNVQRFGLISGSQDWFSGTFPLSPAQLDSGDVIGYRIVARDRARRPNYTILPAQGYFKFYVRTYRAHLLLIDDNADAAKVVTRTENATTLQSATLLCRWLQTAGYYVSTVKSTESTTDFNKYNLLVVSSGANLQPLALTSLRTELREWLTLPHHKLLIEGGELGYYWAGMTPNDTAFAHQVLHIASWNGDAAGNLHLNPNFWYHPVATQPTALPANLNLLYNSRGDQDAVKPLALAQAIFYNESAPQTAGVLIYDDNRHPQSGQVVYLPFNLAALADTLVAKKLVQNATSYLLAPELPANGIISGRVDLSDKDDDSGVRLVLSGTMETTTLTDSLGNFKFTNLFDGYYNLRVQSNGYYCADSLRSFLYIAQNELNQINFYLVPVQLATIMGVVRLEGENDHGGVQITLVNQNRSCLTNSDGSFLFNDIQPGRIQIMLSKIGFNKVLVDTLIDNGDTLSLSILMRRYLPPPLQLQASQRENVVRLTWLAAGSCTEGFEAGIPADWQIGNYGSDSEGRTWSVSSNNAYSGNQAAFCPFGNPGEVSNEWLITNPVLISPQAHVLKFFHAAAFNTDDNLPNYVRVSNSALDTATFTIVQTFPGYPESLPNEWTQVAIDLSAYIGQQVYIAFQYQSVFGEIWYLDEITLEGDMQTKSSTKALKQVPETKQVAALLNSAPQLKLPSVLGMNILLPIAYQIYRAEQSPVQVSAERILARVPADSLAFEDATVVNGLDYHYVVVADYGEYGLSQPSNEVVIRPENQPPPTPANFTAQLIQNRVYLHWSPVKVPDLAGYRLWRSFGRNSFQLLADLKDTLWTDTLAVEGPYRYYVAAYDNGKPTQESTQSLVIIIRYGKQPPENLIALSNQDGCVPLSWSPPVFNAEPSGVTLNQLASRTIRLSRIEKDFRETVIKSNVIPKSSGSQMVPSSSQNGLSQPTYTLNGYIVYRATSSPVKVDSTTRLTFLGGSVTSYRDSAVVNGCTYYYVVTAMYDSIGESIPSNEACATPNRTVSILDLTVVSRIDSVVLRWSDPTLKMLQNLKNKRVGTVQSSPLAVYYQVWRSSDGVNFISKADSLLSFSFTDKNVTGGETYWYYINARHVDGAVYTSNLLKVTVLTHSLIIFQDDFESGSISDSYTLVDNDNQSGFISYDPDIFLPFAWTIRAAPEYSAWHGNYSIGTGYNANGAPNDDWLIFPPIRVEGADVFFEAFLSSQDPDYLEDAEVLISTSGKNLADFQLVQKLTAIKGEPEWQAVHVELAPYLNKVVYLAIRCTSVNKFVLKLDLAGFYGRGNMVESQLTVVPLPSELSLAQNYPNPFNASTTITYHLPAPMPVTLTIYDFQGRQVRTLVTAMQAAGSYQVIWDGRDNARQYVGSGIYFYRLKAGTKALVRKLILLK